MRIWDIDPGFLNDRSLLGEHLELHGIASILLNRKKGYSRHPETLRWSGRLGALGVRHQLLVSEMALRGFNHRSPLGVTWGIEACWPDLFIDQPAAQYDILRGKYEGKGAGRIPLPRNITELWASHKYSVMARDYNAYRRYGKLVAGQRLSFNKMAGELVAWLRQEPAVAGLRNVLLHMWGYLVEPSLARNPEPLALCVILDEIRGQAMGRSGSEYLRHSTALGELAWWCQP